MTEIPQKQLILRVLEIIDSNTVEPTDDESFVASAPNAIAEQVYEEVVDRLDDTKLANAVSDAVFELVSLLVDNPARYM